MEWIAESQALEAEVLSHEAESRLFVRIVVG